MKNKLVGFSMISTLSIVASIATVFAVVDSSGLLNAKAGIGDDYSLVLNGTTNILSPSKSYFVLAGGNQIGVDYTGYTHSSNSDWGILSQDGYFTLTGGQLTGRLGGLTNISYHVSGNLTIEYGYDAPDKPTYYSATIDGNYDSFSFPEDKGYPDRFKITNDGGSEVTITDMTFYYTCSRTDDHVHVSDHVIERITENNVVRYVEHCDICTEEMVVDLSQYSIFLGTGYTSEGRVLFTPYNLDSYTGPGTLEFDYTNNYTKRFILTIDGDYSSSNLYIDTNVEAEGHSSAFSSLYVRSELGAKIHDITAKGGNGIMIFDGSELTFVKGRLDSEMGYVTVRSPLTFSDDRHLKDAVIITNGQLTLESGANVTIRGYDRGMNFTLAYDTTHSGGLEQTGGNLNISDCNTGIYSDHSSRKHSPKLRFKSYAKISGSKVGIQDCDIQVGDNSNNQTGKLLIDVDNSKSTSSSDRSYGIKIVNDQNIVFSKGQAAIYSHNWNYTAAIGVTGNFRDGMLYVEQGFQYGFCNINLGFECSYTEVANFSNTSESTFYYASCPDTAWGCDNKPSGTNLVDSHPSDWEATFYKKFGI